LLGPLGPLVTESGRLKWQETHVAAIERRFGADNDGQFACPVPGHSGRARIDTPDEGPEWEARLFCCTGRWRSLGEVRAAIAYGTDGKRSNIQLATWTRLLAHEIGAFAPYRITLPELPPDAGPLAQRAREGFGLLFGLRWADGEHRPVAWSVRFAVAWCGFGQRDAQLATRTLRETGVVIESGRIHQVRLYLPGATDRPYQGERRRAV